MRENASKRRRSSASMLALLAMLCIGQLGIGPLGFGELGFGELGPARLWAADTKGATAKGVVNINTASAEQLAFLPRVGPSVAGRIIQFREKNGKFKDPTDLLLVRGIGDTTFELIEPYVTLSGETSLREKVKVARKGGGTDWGAGGRG